MNAQGGRDVCLPMSEASMNPLRQDSCADSYIHAKVPFTVARSLPSMLYVYRLV